MSSRYLMNKRKLLVDDIVSVSLVIIIIFLAIYSQLLAIMSLGVYPLSSLILYGLYRSYKSFFDKKLAIVRRVLNLLFGITSIIIAGYILIYMFTRPNIPVSFIIFFLGLPIFLIGLAGILKGLIVKVYSPLYRLLNVLIGATTLLFINIAIFFTEIGYVFHLFTLLTALTLNGILRAALYLSEYGLSLKSYKNFKLIFFIMDSPRLHQQEEN
ncbi:MAG: hypothetical protein HWN80_07015 [Candidatus Lokiarchaeota archaeon]|nr:hypothetical protein [Candidatus Lokiarchaeota archaeon]